MTMHVSDRINHFETALRSIETQSGMAAIHIYLCCDGPLSAEQSIWLTLNEGRFHKVLQNPECIGLAGSLNRLLDALGDEEFVFRMDGDDISHPGRFEVQVAYMRAHPELGLIGCQVMDIDDAGTSLAQRSYPQDEQAVARSLTRLIPVLHPTFCMRRKILHARRARYPEAYLTEDLAFLIRLTEMGVRIGNCPQVLFSWRTGAGFFRRRASLRRGLTEMKWYARAVHMQDGLLSAAYLYPLLRLIMRLLPQGVLRLAYRSGIRSLVSRSTLGNEGRAIAGNQLIDTESAGSDTFVAAVRADAAALRLG